MKSLAIASACIFLAAVSFAIEPVGTNVGTTSICVLPARAVSAVPAWSEVTGKTVRAGMATKLGAQKYFVITCTNGALAVDAPVHTSGGVLGADSVLWQAYTEPDKKYRSGLSVTKCMTSSSNLLYVSIGSPAVVGKGVPLYSQGSTFLIPSGAPQDAVYAISGAVNDLFAAQDW